MLVKSALVKRNTVILPARPSIDRRALLLTGVIIRSNSTGDETMSTNQDQVIEQFVRNYVSRVCPHCHEDYILGVDGVEAGCDICEGIVRNPIDHTIIYEDFETLFPEEVES